MDRLEVRCTVCGEAMRMSGGRYGGYMVIPSDLTSIEGIGLVVFASGAYDPPLVAQHGVCGIPCAVRQYGEMLQGLAGVRPAAHMAPERAEVKCG